MIRRIESWSVQKILTMLWNNQLNYKPNIQRQFVYKPEQQQQVLMSIKKGFLAAALVIEEDAPNSYLLLDGKQRINSIIGFINKAFSLDSFYFDDHYRRDRIDTNNRYKSPDVTPTSLPDSDVSDSAILLRYEFPVVLYSGLTLEERLVLFNVINTTGEKLNTWELINGRYPSGVLFNMRTSYFNERLQANTTTIDPNFINVKRFEKYFGTHDVNRGELYIKIIEKLYDLYNGEQNDQPYEIIDGIRINTKNYNRLCKFIELHITENFDVFAEPLISRLEVFYDMFGDVNNLGPLKEACFYISDSPLFNANKAEFETKKDVLAYLITQYNNSDIKGGNDHKTYFENNILPLALIIPGDFRTKLDQKRFFTTDDRERLMYANASYNPVSKQVKCQGVMNDGVTPCGCGKWMSKEEATVDHINPWILGGKTDDTNAQLLCHECNSRKGSTIISDILSKQGGATNGR